MFRLSTGVAFGAVLAAAVATPLAVATAAPPTATPAADVAARSAALSSAQARADQDRAALGLSTAEKLVVKDVVTDPDGTQHVRYDRTFKGLRVIGGDLIVAKTKAGATTQVIKNGSGTVEVASISPQLSRSAALAAGKAAGPKTSSPTGELVVWAGGSKPVLAYDVLVESVRADQVPSRLHTIVDASTGASILSFDEIQTGTGDGIYYDGVQIETRARSGGGFEMVDTHGNNTRDAQNQGNPNTGVGPAGDLLVDADDAWGNGSVSNRASAGVDAHYGATTTFNYYKNVLGRNGIFSDGRGVPSRVHFANAMANAFWDGAQMSYGDGAGNQSPLTEIDVAGHEMSHGITENTAGLVYSGDAGGLNEATSDIFGTAVEFYANNPGDPGDYFIGEELDLRGNGTPLRYMDKPSKDGASQDCWTTGTKNLDPHYSSGPLNHWFFMAAEGSGARTVGGVSYNSPTCGGAGAVTGAGRANIEKVWYRTLSTKLTSNSNYAAARNGAIASAKELYGATSATCTAVQAAFNAIAVPAGSETCGGTTTPPPTSGNLLANPGFESGAVTWTGTSGAVTNNTGRPARTGSWKAWLGGNGRTASESVQQNVSIPSSATAATLSFWLRTDTAETGSTVYDTMKVQVVSGSTTTTLATYSNVGTNATYTQKSFNLTAYKGKTVTVKFASTEDSSLQTSFVVDDAAVGAS